MKNKKGILVFLLAGFFLVSLIGIFGVFADPIYAQENNGAALAGVQNGDLVDPGGDNIVITGFKWFLYALLFILIKFVQVAASVFAWATNPGYISGPTGLLNLESVYTLWKFVRDFFNLFFIFLLLFAAFSTVFQIEQYGLKKNFSKIIIAAIAINFSFPLTRLIIDLGNVPMYFFAEGIVTGGGGNALLSIPQALFSTTGVANILAFPDPNQSTVTSLITAIIFTFIFMITLFSLALLFVIRLLKLMILLIFSPLGVAASLVPGLSQFGKKWWSQLMQTVLFGPAAMLMIVVALRFSAEIQGTAFSQGLSPTAPAASAESQSSVIAQAVFFIPIILMWMAMKVGGDFGIEGSKAVLKKAEAVAAWGKKQALFSKGSLTRRGVAAAPGAASIRGAGAGLKSRYEDKVTKPLKNRQELAEARGKAFIKGGSAGVTKEMNKIRDKEANGKLAEWKKDNKTPEDILKELKDKNNYEKDGVTPKAGALAAATFLAGEKDAIKNTGELTQALGVASQAKKKDLVDKLLQNADGDALELTPEQLTTIQETYEKNIKPRPAPPERKEGQSDESYAQDVAKARKKYEDEFNNVFKQPLKKKGKLKYIIDHEIAVESKKGPVDIPAVYAKHMGKMKPKEVAQMDGIYKASGELDDNVRDQIRLMAQDWSQKDKQDAFSELGTKNKEAWRQAGLAPGDVEGNKKNLQSGNKSPLSDRLEEVRRNNRPK